MKLGLLWLILLSACVLAACKEDSRELIPGSDTDNDGVVDASDLCPNTSPGASVNTQGCAIVAPHDADSDGVPDTVDACPNTPANMQVNASGCPAMQVDTDQDSVPDHLDACPNTPMDAQVNASGCPIIQLDADWDGVPDHLDVCPDSPINSQVNPSGCPLGQADADSDGVSDQLDACPNTPMNVQVNASGCPLVQSDADRDGVPDHLDACPNTPMNAQVDASGCPRVQSDADSDGVSDQLDACPNTPMNVQVNASGCPLVQSDADRDGVPDHLDACPNTPMNAQVDASGCPLGQADSDRDGVPDHLDACPNTAMNTQVNASGCPLGQADSDRDGVPDHLDACPNTAMNTQVNASGCPVIVEDTDRDGITDDRDLCPDTSINTQVDEMGCPIVEADSDSDGVVDDLDVCPDTPPNSQVDEIGCLIVALDSDNDGIPDSLDMCGNTPDNTQVDANGCAVAPVEEDKDRDGLADESDDCPNVAGPASNHGCPVMNDTAEGARYYAVQCAGCHYDGEQDYLQALESGDAATDMRSLIDPENCASCSSQSALSSFITATMPLTAPSSCSGECAEQTAKYILSGYYDPSKQVNQLSAFRRLTHQQYLKTTRGLLNFNQVLSPELAILLPDELEVDGLNNIAEAQTVGGMLAASYFEIADTLAKEFVEGLNTDSQYLSALGCASDMHIAACGRDFRQRFLSAAFRRPVTLVESAGYEKVESDVMALTSSESASEQRKLALRAFLVSALVSPEYIYLVERGQSPFNGGLQLTNLEIANRLSYLLTDSAPDQELVAAANSGTLIDPDVRVAHFDRLINTNEAKIRLRNILQGWLGIDLNGTNKQLRRALNPDDNKDFGRQEGYKKEAIENLQAFLQDWLENNKSFDQFYTAPVATRGIYFSNGKVALPGPAHMPHIGIFGLEAFIGSHTSEAPTPITRGVFVGKKLLCATIPPPPPTNIPEIVQRQPGQSVKSWLAEHVDNPGCAGCHRTIDNLGFPFLKFNQYGIYDSFSTTIDASADLVSIGDIGGPVNGLPEFASMVAESKQARTCMANLMFRHIYGRYEHETDAEKIDELVEAWNGTNGGLLDLLELYVKSDDFITLVHQ